MNKTIKTVLITLGVVLTIGAIWYKFESTSNGGNFTLNNEKGKWKFNQNSKKLNLLYFGFTKCGSVCPMALATTSSAYDRLTDDERQNVRVIFVSVDHEHDKPQDVSDYAKSFHKDFIGITGNKQQIDNTIDLFPAGYAIQYDTSFALGYSVAHTDKIFFLNKDGKKIDEISEPRNEKDIITKIRKNL